MKKIFFSTLVLTLMATALFAQKKVKKEGVVKYKVTDIDSKDMQAQMMKGSTVEAHISEDKTFSTMSMMGGMVTIKSYEDKKEGELVTLMNMMAKKMKIHLTAEDIKKREAENGAKDMSVEYTYDKSVNKEIAGYNCYQATGKDANGSEMILYITEKIDLNPGKLSNQAGIDYKNLDGFPLEYTIKRNGLSMTFTAQNVSAKLDKSIFEYNDEGYEKVNPEDLGKMMGGGLGL